MQQGKMKSLSNVSKEWGISQRRIIEYCNEGRISGAEKIGNMWIIPSDTKKPADARSCEFISDFPPKIKPFVKWAGGKGQLLREIRSIYPKELGKSIKKYAEPFVGGGAVLFDILGTYKLDEVYISDVNKELLNTYIVIKEETEELIDRLNKLQKEHIVRGIDERKKYYYANRELYNELKKINKGEFSIELASLFIYLNKTCFNGLYRVNSSGLFNTPAGSYANPMICDEKNLKSVAIALNNVKIECGSFLKSESFIDGNTFAYFDPPYRPLTTTSSFTSYSENSFNDDNQCELAEFVKKMSERGAKIALSNSDPKNIDPGDMFFDKLYSDFNIKRINAIRAINSKGDSRGKITELLITNY